ncbi:MAG: molybdopterin-dependent oxidoreductase, partial [Xanthomonadaceae bacterium]|nr:molybdopterin-dependent oxidoreductase [Xanthomonadaceae bacterium]
MALIKETDYGTPASKSEKMVTLTIDGVEVTVPEGTSIMRAAMEMGTTIPKLCATDMLESFGSCRLCLIEIEGRNGTPASCTTPVAPGIQVHTQTPRLAAIRKGVMELYISDHPLDCLTCPANGDCELEDMAGAVGLREVRYGYDGANHVFEKSRLDNAANDLWLSKDGTNPYFAYDPSKCIVCNRCVRACEEVQGTFALTISGRGFDSRVSAGMNEDFLESECVSCGACVQACPTATLIEKSVIEIGQPEHSVITTCAYCGVGCAFKAEMRGEEVVRMVPWKDGKANRGHSCVKGRFAYGYTTHQDRITKPMVRDKITDPWREVSWEEAIARVAGDFRRLQEQYGRESVGGITSSRCTNEEAYLVQKLIRAGFGVNNVDTCARVCHSPTGYGLKTTVGESAGTQDFDSIDDTDVILVIGANPPDAHPVFGSHMKKRIREGAKLIVIDPRRTDLVKSPHVKADYHLALQPGTNVAVVTAMAHVIVTEGLVNETFVRERCERDEFEEWAAFVSLEVNSPEAMEKYTGVKAELIRGAARLYATGGNAAIYYGLGVTEHSQGSTTVMAIANIAMATGNMGRTGVGVNPLRGQNNVQGSCDMASVPHELTGYRHISDVETRTAFEREWNCTLDPEP